MAPKCTFDGNGNITRLTQHNAAGTMIDNTQYHYPDAGAQLFIGALPLLLQRQGGRVPLRVAGLRLPQLRQDAKEVY